MFCFPIRRKERKGDLPKLPASRAMDFGIFHKLCSPEDSPGDAEWWQPAATDPEEFSRLCWHRRPGKGWGLSKVKLWNWGGSRNSQGARESWRDTGMPGKVGDAPGCAEVAGKEPGTCWNGRGGNVQQEKLKVENTPNGIQLLGKDIRDELKVGNTPSGIQLLGKDVRDELKVGNTPSGIQLLGKDIRNELKVGNTPSGIQLLRKDIRDEPGVPCKARDGDVPREATDQPQPPLQAGPSRNEEGRSSGSSQSLESSVEEDTDTATAPGGDGNARGPEPPSAAGTSGAESRRQLLERLCQLGKPMENWEGQSTTALLAQLGQVVPAKDSESCPTEPGVWSVHREQGSGASQDLEPSVPVSIPEPRSGASFLGMLAILGNGESREHSEQDSDSEVVSARSALALAQKFPAVWVRSRADCGLVAEELDLPGAPVPFQKQRPQRPHTEELMAEMLQEYLDEGIVVEGRSTSNNPLILVPKSHGSGWYLTLHCKALDKATPMDSQERLDPAGFVTSVNPRSRFFSVLDLSKPSLAIPLAPSCRSRFAFTFRGRQFLFTRLPPGFHGATSIVHRRVAAMLSRLEPGAARGVLHYVDDILITGKSRRQAKYRTRRVLELIQSTGFKARWEKAQLVQPEVKYLGTTIGATGRRIPKEKVEEIAAACDAPGPWNAHALRSLLGKFIACQDYIPDCCELVLPLQRLLEKPEWEWGPEQKRQLQRLREALEAAPALRFPDKSRPFLIRMALHAETATATLLQEKAGTLLPVRYSSHRLNGNLSLMEQGCLEAVRAVRAFERFTGPAPVVLRDLFGNYLVWGQPFSSRGSGFPEQWTLLLTSEGRNVWRSQTTLIPWAPSPQQLPSSIPKSNVWSLVVMGMWPAGFAAANLEGRWLLGVSWADPGMDMMLEVLLELLEQHRSSSPLFLYPCCPNLATRLGSLEVEQGWDSGGEAQRRVLRWLRAFPGMLCVGVAGSEPEERAWMERVEARASAMAVRGGRSRKIWEPSKYERQEIVSWCHRWHHHDGLTLAKVREVQSWNNSRRNVARWVQRCPECRDPRRDPNPAPQRPEGPWSSLWISLSNELPRTPEGFCALLVVQDEFSGWVDAFPLRQRAEPEVTWLLLQEVFRRFGKVRSVSLPPVPTWLWNSMNQAPLRDFRSCLQCSQPMPAASSLWRVAQAAGMDWGRMLPLILAGIRSGCIHRERLGPLLSTPGLPLEWRWEGPGLSRDNNELSRDNNELSRLRGMQVLAGYRERLEAVLP